MTKIIDGEGAIMGRLASYAAKEALKGEDIVILNAEKAVITGRRENIKKRFDAKRLRVGSSQKGPKISRAPEKILKRAIRGMLPHTKGRGVAALKRIKCYIGIPKEFENVKKISGGKEIKSKFITIDELKK